MRRIPGRLAMSAKKKRIARDSPFYFLPNFLGSQSRIPEKHAQHDFLGICIWAKRACKCYVHKSQHFFHIQKNEMSVYTSCTVPMLARMAKQERRKREEKLHRGEVRIKLGSVSHEEEVEVEPALTRDSSHSHNNLCAISISGQKTHTHTSRHEHTIDGSQGNSPRIHVLYAIHYMRNTI